VYRIVVRGVMSERFCRGFHGLRRSVEDGTTVLEGDGSAPPAGEVVAALGNLGLEVVDVRSADTGTAESEEV
jgi:hypothetical protein